MSAFPAINFATTSTWPFLDASWSGESPSWEEVKAYEFTAIWIQFSHKGPLQLQCPSIDLKKNTTKELLVRLLEVYFPVLVRVDSCAKILRRDKHLPGVVTETCGACWFFRSPLGQRNPKPTSHTGHVFSASEKQSIFLVEIALEIVATIYWKAKCPITSSITRIVVRLSWIDLKFVSESLFLVVPSLPFLAECTKLPLWKIAPNNQCLAIFAYENSLPTQYATRLQRNPS